MSRKTKSPQSPFPEIILADVDIKQIKALVDQFLTAALDDYQQYLVDDLRQVDTERWKFFKARNGLRTYVERKPGGWRNQLSNVDGSTITATTSDLPLILGAGTQVGTLDDCMLGLVVPTRNDIRVQYSYTDNASSTCILASIIEPTTTDPFTSLNIKWSGLDFPLHQTQLVKNRDFVYMEATGIARLQSGERVAYNILHSISFPQTCALPGRVRANVSVFGLFRQASENVIDVYGTCIIDMGGKASRHLSVAITADVIFANTKYVYCARMKKLAWAVHQSQQRRSTQTQRLTSGNKACVMCEKDPSRGLYVALKRYKCSICMGFLCMGCRIKHKLYFITSDDELVRKNLAFCVRCIQKAVCTSAWEAARNHLGPHAFRLGCTLSSQSSSPTSTITDITQLSYDEMQRSRQISRVFHGP